MAKFKSGKSGFSLIETSIVILVIGLIVAGALSASRVVNYMLLNTARDLTENSALNYMRRDVIVWFDTTSEKSFADSEVQDKSPITNWYETMPVKTIPATATQNTNSQKPLYSANALNGLPGLKFDGVDDLMSITSSDYINSSTPAFYNNFSVFLVAQSLASITINSESNFSTSGQSSQRYALFPASGDTVYPSMPGAAAGAGISFGLNGIGIYENASGYTPPILSSSVGYSGISAVLMEYKDKNPKLYVNNKFVRSGLTSLKNYVFPPFYIGGGPSPWNGYGNFSGYIGEIIIIDRALTAEERADIFAYLKKKWKLNY